MFTFKLLNIMVGQKISYNDKARSSARKGLGAKSACFTKRLFFISKELQLIQRIIVNRAVPYTSETSGTNSSLLMRKKNLQGKRREKRKQGARLVEALKSHITQIQMFSKKLYFHFKEVTITSEDYKIFLYISENYNQQSRSLHLKKLQSAKPFPTSIDHDRPTLVKEKTTRKGKRNRKGGRRGKEGRTSIMEKAGLKSVPSKAYRPL